MNLLSMHNQADAGRILVEAAQAYKVDVDAITAKVKQEFSAKEKSKLGTKQGQKSIAKPEPKAP